MTLALAFAITLDALAFAILAAFIMALCGYFDKHIDGGSGVNEKGEKRNG